MARTRTANGPLVLVIEADEALRHIMLLGLRQRGLRVLATPSLRIAWELLDEAPALVVLDIGVGASSEWMWPRLVQRHRLLRAAPMVLLAWECPVGATARPSPNPSASPPRLCLAKPFDARALYAAVDAVLAGAATAREPAPEAPLNEAIGARERAVGATSALEFVPLAAATLPASAASGVSLPPPATHGPLLSAEIAEIAEPLVEVGRNASDPVGALDRRGNGDGSDGELGLRATPEPLQSIWPLIAAGAATLAVAGFLIRPLYALVGLLLLTLVLLWWSTAQRARPRACDRRV